MLTGLLAQAGFWTGKDTVIKDNSTGKYDTYENSQLVELNKLILSGLGEKADNNFWYRNDVRNKLNQLSQPQLDQEIISFVEECSTHMPWVWKDPILWQTLGFWLKYLDTSQLKIIVLYRRSFPLWISQTSKRIIYDYADLKAAEKTARVELLKFLHHNDLDYQEVEYDLLTARPAEVIYQLNKFLSTQLNVTNWNRIYHNPLTYFGNIKRNILALLIYLKNYSQRIRLMQS